MRPDKFKRKCYFKGDHREYDDKRTKQVNLNFIQDEDLINELPSKVPSTVSYGSRHYSNALLRLIRSKLGSKWDDVYSELSEKLGDHKDDLKWYVALNAYKNADGQIVALSHWGEQEVRGFYVLDGILGEQRKRFKSKPDSTKIKVTYVKEFVVFKHKNIYFKAPLNKSIPIKELYWRSTSTSYERTDNHIIYTDKRKSKHVYNELPKFAIPATHIRQLSSKEVAHWDLPNTEINENIGWFYV
jgi:hypothetical protein